MNTDQRLFPFCPTPPAWELDFAALCHHFHWLRAMEDVPQDPLYHAEGDVLIHTHMVAQAMVALPEWRALPPEERSLLFAAALLHDVGKPACTKREETGRITSKGHAREGEHISRRIGWLGEDLPQPLSFQQREHLAMLVRYHGLPLVFLDKPQPERAVVAASQSVRLDHVALLAEADVRGRIAADSEKLLTQIALFRDFCEELQCYRRPRQFATDHSRFTYFQREHIHIDYVSYDETTFEVILLSGLPGVGKDTWISTHYSSLPVITLDALRKTLHISPEDDQGRVIQAAREQARILMRNRQSFVWNATNVIRMRRRQLVDFFVSYGARVRIVYLDAPFATILARNAQRSERIPEQVIYKMLAKLEVPDLTEAHAVEKHTNI